MHRYDIGEGSLDTSELEENIEGNTEIKPVILDNSAGYGEMQTKDVAPTESVVSIEEKEDKHPVAMDDSPYGYIQTKQIDEPVVSPDPTAMPEAKILGSSTPADERMTLGRGVTVSSDVGQKRIIEALKVVAAERKQAILEEKKSMPQKSPDLQVGKDKKNIPETDKKAVEFISNTRSDPSLVVSICAAESGGCYAFGESMARELKADYIGVESMSDFLGKDVVKSQINSEQLYHNICVTGCRCHASFVVEELSHVYGFNGVRNVYVVLPPHMIDLPNESKIVSDAKKSFTFSTNFSVELIKTGGDPRAANTIGIPNPIPILSESKEEMTPKNCYGLMYIPRMIKDESYSSPTRFLNLYFSEIVKTAGRQSIDSPTIYAVTGDKNEKKLIQEIAKNHGVGVLFVDRLPPEQFAIALKEISQRGGIIANNGVQTAIQTFILKGKVLYYPSEKNNFQFITKMLEGIPEPLKETAKVILGISNRAKLLEDIDKVNQVNEILQLSFSASVSKFEHAKEQHSLSENICLGLNKITQLKWSYDPVLQLASAVCTSSESKGASKDLTSQGYDVREETVSANTLWQQSKLVVGLTQPSIEKLIEVSREESTIGLTKNR